MKIQDTIFPTASFNKGGLFTGTQYLLVSYNEKQYWVPQDYCLTYIDYAYDTQNLKFSAQDENENILFWERAQKYTNMYQKYHSKEDRINNISNDTLIETSYYNYDGNKWLKISRKKINEQYVFTVDAAEHRGSEPSIIPGLSLDNKRIPNSITCAYYIQHGSFYREEK